MRRNRQIQDNLQLVRPIARHYAQQTGLETDDLLQVGFMGLIKACSRYDSQLGGGFQCFAKAHIRGPVLHFLRDKVCLIRLPRAVGEQAMLVMLRLQGSLLSPTDALVVHQYRSKQRWVEFNDDLVDGTPEGTELVERSDAWSWVRRMFRRLEKDDQRAMQMIVIEGRSLRQAAQHFGVSAMAFQRRIKRGLNSLAEGLNNGQLDA